MSGLFKNFNLEFDFDFDQDVQNEMSSMETRVKTENEINKCYTNEDFTQFQKAMHIMMKGYEVQKKSVVSNLDQYVDDIDTFQNLISLIINSIDTWDNEFQILFGQSLGRCADKQLIDCRNL